MNDEQLEKRAQLLADLEPMFKEAEAKKLYKELSIADQAAEMIAQQMAELHSPASLIEEAARWGETYAADTVAGDFIHDIAAALSALLAENAALKAQLAQHRDVVDKQAEDSSLRFLAETASEAYLQQELRKMHAVIEADDTADHIAEHARVKAELAEGDRALIEMACRVDRFLSLLSPNGRHWEFRLQTDAALTEHEKAITAARERARQGEGGS